MTLSVLPQCSEHPTAGEVLAIQNLLWRTGLARAAGALDTLIAAYAIKNEAILCTTTGTSSISLQSFLTSDTSGLFRGVR